MSRWIGKGEHGMVGPAWECPVDQNLWKGDKRRFVVKYGEPESIQHELKISYHFQSMVQLGKISQELINRYLILPLLSKPCDAKEIEEKECVECKGKESYLMVRADQSVQEDIKGFTTSTSPREVKKFTVHDLLFIIRQVAAGLHMMHRLGVSHNDVLPRNVMLSFSNGRLVKVQLIDFGHSKLEKGKDWNETRESNGVKTNHGMVPFITYILENGTWPSLLYQSSGKKILDEISNLDVSIQIKLQLVVDRFRM